MLLMIMILMTAVIFTHRLSVSHNLTLNVIKMLYTSRVLSRYLQYTQTTQVLINDFANISQFSPQESQRNNKGGSGKGGEGATGSASDYQEGASHVLSVIHDILAQHRGLEAKWHAKKIKLHQRLALRLFQEDVKQVNVRII